MVLERQDERVGRGDERILGDGDEYLVERDAGALCVAVGHDGLAQLLT